jgi:hypothetical protein
MIFAFVGSFSMLFMELFFIAGILSTKIQRNVEDETNELKNLKSYTAAAAGGLVAGLISLTAMIFL